MFFITILQAIDNNIADIAACETLPSIANLSSQVNNARKDIHPAHPPNEPDFQLDLDHIPAGFLRKDINHERRRCLIFATDNQLSLLETATTWYFILCIGNCQLLYILMIYSIYLIFIFLYIFRYVDGTFKVVQKPFLQLYSIHTFQKSGTCYKQVPLVFILMNRRQKADYIEVFKEVFSMVPGCQVSHIVCDFEAAFWQAIRYHLFIFFYVILYIYKH